MVRTAEDALAHLVEILDLGDLADGHEATWDDVVYYAAKAKSSARMANQAVRRRSERLAEALGMPPESGWMEMIREVEKR